MPMEQEHLLLGLGNALRGDDGVGLVLVEMLSERCAGVKTMTAPLAGFDLLEMLRGVERLYIIDAMLETEQGQAELQWWQGFEAIDRLPLLSCHGLNILQIIAVGRRLGYPIPRHCLTFGVRIKADSSIRQGLSDNLQRRLPELAERINWLIDQDINSSDDIGDRSCRRHSCQ